MKSCTSEWWRDISCNLVSNAASVPYKHRPIYCDPIKYVWVLRKEVTCKLNKLAASLKLQVSSNDCNCLQVLIAGLKRVVTFLKRRETGCPVAFVLE